MNIIKLLTPKKDVVCLYENNSLRQALERMHVHRYAAVPVLSLEGAYLGSVKEGDFLYFITENKLSFDDLENISLMDIVDRESYRALTIRSTFDELCLRILNNNFVPVIDDRGLFMGIIKRRDVLTCLIEEQNSNVARPALAERGAVRLS